MENSSIVGQCFNLSTNQPFNVIQIVQEILELMHAKNLKPIIQNNTTNEIPEQHLSSQKAHRLLGWNARYGVKKGLEETIAWYKNFFAKQDITQDFTSIRFSPEAKAYTPRDPAFAQGFGGQAASLLGATGKSNLTHDQNHEVELL
jgi:dTDP-D-glucose 4,6-dehydratase